MSTMFQQSRLACLFLFPRIQNKILNDGNCPMRFAIKKKTKQKETPCLQHVVFPGGHPSKY